MWSLKLGLARIENHLPSGFEASHGVKSLFPQKYTGSVSALKDYVYSAYARLSTDYDFGNNGGPPNYLPNSSVVKSSANTYVMADGAGRWFFSWVAWNVQYPSHLFSFFIQSGFVFHFSNDGNAHGFVDTSNPQPNEVTGSPYYNLFRSCSSGQDAWIANNWPQIFKAGRHILLWEGAEPPDPSPVWTGAGFAQPNFTQLDGAICACTLATSGSNLFPFPSTPYRLLSPLGLILRLLIDTAGALIGKNLSSVPKTFTTSNGLKFEVIAPPGMKPGDSGNVTVNFFNASKSTKGSFVWSFPAGVASASGAISFDSGNGSCALSYSYASATPSPDSPICKLQYTVLVTALDNSVSLVSQTVENGLVTSQTTSSTDASGNGSTTVTINPDGTLQITNPNPNTASTLGVPVSPAQKIPLIDRATNPAVNLLIAVFGSSLNPPDPLLVYGLQQPGGGGLNTTPITIPMQNPAWGPGSCTLTPVGGENGDPVAIEYTFSVGTGAPGGVNVSGDYYYASAAVQAPIISSFNGEFPMPDGGSYTVNYTTMIPSPGPNYLYTSQFTLQDPDGSSYSSYQAGSVNPFAPPGQASSTIASQTVSVIDSDANAVTTTIRFNEDGTFTLTIQSQDAANDGTFETMQIDSQGNLTSDTTDVLSGGVIGAGNGDDDDDDDDDAIL
jgi:hypothetical protein